MQESRLESFFSRSVGNWVMAIVLFIGSGTAVSAQEATRLKGKVIDVEGHPLAGVRIVIHNGDKNEEVSGRSNGKGNFSLEHSPSSSLSFDVYPPEKLGLTAAHYSNVSGEFSKHFIVKLHKGFRVTGRVLAEGQGVKNLQVRAFGQDGADATVHGGGLTSTRGNGEFVLLLTPGKKTIQIRNDVYSNLSPLYQHEFTVTSDMCLPDMTLPLLK